MSRAGWSGFVLLAVAAVGCGGARSSGAGGAGGRGDGDTTSGAGGAGGRGDGDMTGGAGGAGGRDGDMTGRAGTSGVSYDAGPGDSPYNGDYVWGDVAIHVGPTSVLPGYLLLQVSDPAVPGTGIAAGTYPSATHFSPNDGAYVMAHFGCSGGSLYQIDIYSCANETVVGGTALFGCIGVTFIERGVTGNFIGNDGVRCDVRGGIATMDLPPPNPVAPTDGGPPAPAASGTFLLDCARGDGTELLLESKFELPVAWRLLAC